MGRQKTIFHFSKHGIELLRQYENINATQVKMAEMFKDPELDVCIESKNAIAISILDKISKNLKIIGKPDMEYIKQEYEYYKELNQINPEYENFLEENKMENKNTHGAKRE